VGQEADFKEIEERAYLAVSSKHYTIDAKVEFAERFIAPAIMLNAFYEGKYPIGTALARPLIAEKVVEVAIREGADAVAHGCTSKGNDQVRFDLVIRALAPNLVVLAPARVWKMTRSQEIAYAKSRGIPVPEVHKKYSIDDNLWSRSIEGGELDDISVEPPEEVFKWTSSPVKAPNEPLYLELEFDRGIPVAINGERMELVQLISALNKVAGLHGVGRIDHVESRTIGFKSREVYEAPAAVVIREAHIDLEKLVLTPRELRFKHYFMDPTWTDLVYQGLWIEPLREEIESLAREMERWVSGSVRLKLYKGGVSVVGRTSSYSTYKVELANYDVGWYPSDEEARGFITAWGLHSLTARWVRTR